MDLVGATPLALDDHEPVDGGNCPERGVGSHLGRRVADAADEPVHRLPHREIALAGSDQHGADRPDRRERPDRDQKIAHEPRLRSKVVLSRRPHPGHGDEPVGMPRVTPREERNVSQGAAHEPAPRVPGDHELRAAEDPAVPRGGGDVRGYELGARRDSGHRARSRASSAACGGTP